MYIEESIQIIILLFFIMTFWLDEKWSRNVLSLHLGSPSYVISEKEAHNWLLGEHSTLLLSVLGLLIIDMLIMVAEARVLGVELVLHIGWATLVIGL